jgi:CBS domain-containing protein
MRRDFEVVHPDATIAEAARRLSRVGTPLPVSAGGHLMGLVGPEDLARPPRHDASSLRLTRIRDLIAPEVVFCLVNTEVDEAAALMHENHLERLPVLDEHRLLVGVLALEDLPQQPEQAPR